MARITWQASARNHPMPCHPRLRSDSTGQVLSLAGRIRPGRGTCSPHCCPTRADPGRARASVHPDEYIDMSPLSRSDRGPLREMAVTTTAPPRLAPPGRRAETSAALAYMAQQFGFLDATADL